MTLSLASTGERRPLQPDTICQPSRRFADLDRRRIAEKIPVRDLLMEAGINYATWYDGKAGRSASRETTLQRIESAIERLKTKGPSARPPVAIKALVLAAEEILRVRVKGRLLRSCNPMRASKAKVLRALPPARLRTLAIYLVAVELEVENVDIARALGCSRENVRKARETVENLREDERVEALFERCGKLLTGRA